MTLRGTDALIDQWYMEIDEKEAQIDTLRDEIDALHHNIFQRTTFLQQSAKAKRKASKK